jgi:peptidoglycan/xylan/chitin deacetylase (PgdA/CDA1 family)
MTLILAKRLVEDGSETSGGGPVSHVVVPCYHAVSETWTADLSVTPDRLRAQLEGFVRQGFRSARFSDALRGPAQARVVAITFDDAFRSVYDIAFPLMRRLGLVGTVFVPTAWPDSDEPMQWDGIDQWLGGPHEAELACMSWDQLRELRDAGWEISAHSHTHPRLTTVDDDRLADELRRSREICATRMGVTCESLAYPYGDVDARVIAAAGAAGFTYAATMKASIPAPEPLYWPRVGIYHRDLAWRWRLKLSPRMVRLRKSRLGEALDRARGV